MKFIIYVLLGFSVQVSCAASAVTSSAGIVAANQAHQNSINQQQNILSHMSTSSRVIGLMTCRAYYEDVNAPGAYDYTGCDTRKGHLSIKKFFDKYKKHENYEIIQVIGIDGMFHIYYGIKNE